MVFKVTLCNIVHLLYILLEINQQLHFPFFPFLCNCILYPILNTATELELQNTVQQQHSTVGKNIIATIKMRNNFGTL